MFLPPKTIFLSSTNKLVFNYDRYKFNYDAGFYIPSLTQDKISTSEVDGFLKEADTIALKTMAKAIKLQKWVVAIFIVLVIILFAAAFGDADSLGKAMIGLIIAYFFFAIVFCVLFEQKKRKELSFRMKALMDHHNGALASRGWRWSVAPHFNSIELNREITNQTPPNQITPTGLVITFRQTPYSCGYNARLYAPEQTDNRLSKQEADDFMSQVNSIASSTIQMTGKLVILYVVFIIVAFIIAIAGSVNRNDGVFKLGIILVVVGVLLGQGFIYLHFNWKRRQMERRMRDLIDQQNPILRQRGLGWYCPSSLLRVDLIRYYKCEEARSLQEVLPPNANDQTNDQTNDQSNNQMANQENQVNGSAAPLSNNDVVLNLVEIPGYENMDNMSLVHNDNVRNNISAIDETDDITQNVNFYPVNDNENEDYTNHNNNGNENNEE